MDTKSIKNFKNRFVKNGKRIDYADKSIAVFQQDKIIVFIPTKGNTLITKSVKEKLEQYFCDQMINRVFVSIFETRSDFIVNSEEIAWGTYVWILSEPEHMIHFDDKPVLKTRHI